MNGAERYLNLVMCSQSIVMCFLSQNFALSEILFDLAIKQLAASYVANANAQIEKILSSIQGKSAT